MTTSDLSDQFLVDAYNAVFAVRGGSGLANAGPPLHYAEDRLRILLDADPSAPLNLTAVCALSAPALLRLLFRAVAGDLVVGAPSALGGSTCRLLADPRSGQLRLERGGDQNEAALTVISLVLLCVIAVLLYRQSLLQQQHAV